MKKRNKNLKIKSMRKMEVITMRERFKNVKRDFDFSFDEELDEIKTEEVSETGEIILHFVLT